MPWTRNFGPAASPASAPSAFGAARPEIARHLLEDADEQLADDLALALGIGHSFQCGEVTVGRLDVHQVDLELPAEGVLDLIRLTGAHEARVHEHAGELLADGLVDECGGHRRVDPSAQGAEHPLGADLRLHGGHLLLDDRHVGPRRQASTRIEEEPLEDLAAPLGVHDLGMELQAEDAPLGVVHGGDGGAVAGGRGHESRRRDRDGIAVAHPDFRCRGPVEAQR